MRSTIHEMRNQLAVAVANIEAFIDGKFVPTADRLGAVLQALNKLDTLMNDVRAAPAVAAPATHLKRVDVCALIVSETLGMEATAAAAGITFDVNVCTHTHLGCSQFLCDAVQVSQVIKNVLLNAIKYTERGGRVKLYCHREPGVLSLDISDSGPGVNPQERATIFERGVRGSAAGGTAGSGVGLAVARDITDAHGGTISVADSPGGGASFTVRLPGETTAADACGACLNCSPHNAELIVPVA